MWNIFQQKRKSYEKIESYIRYVPAHSEKMKKIDGTGFVTVNCILPVFNIVCIRNLSELFYPYVCMYGTSMFRE